MPINTHPTPEITLTPAEAERLLELADGWDLTIRGVNWMRMRGEFEDEDEFKASPHGRQDPDRDCEWWDRQTVTNIADELQAMGGC